MKILIATTNRHKVREWLELLEELLPGTAKRFMSLDDSYEAPAEDGDTFSANAVIKAVSAARHFNCWALADDSGLCVKALDGAPGVYSARYAGEGATDAANRAKLLKAMEPYADRHAEFVCAVALAAPGGFPCHQFEGRCTGHLISQELGSNDFGYDPIFIPDGYTTTFGELPASTKHQLSHRRRALDEARSTIETVLNAS
jgi:XTP/dITP diphosphohydrolase